MQSARATRTEAVRGEEEIGDCLENTDVSKSAGSDILLPTALRKLVKATSELIAVISETHGEWERRRVTGQGAQTVEKGRRAKCNSQNDTGAIIKHSLQAARK